MRVVTFIILDIAGTLLWAGMLAGLGYALGRHAVVVAQGISHYALWFTLAFVALIIISQVRQARAPRGTPVALPAADQGSADQGSADQGNADQGNADAR
jgi:hypothetical protein